VRKKEKSRKWKGRENGTEELLPFAEIKHRRREKLFRRGTPAELAKWRIKMAGNRRRTKKQRGEGGVRRGPN